MKVAVIGAGVIGLTCAWQLAKAGACVTLLDRQPPPTGASAAAAGWVSATDYPRKSRLNRFIIRSAALYPAFMAEVEEASGLDCGFKQTGHLRLAMPGDEALAFKNDLALVKTAPPALEAFCAQSLASGILYRWNGGSYTLAPRRLLEALALAGRAAGVAFTPAEVLDIQEGRVITSDAATAYDAIVVAGGYVRGRLKDLLGPQCRLRPKRGEAIEVALPPGFHLPTILDTPDLYMVPRQLERKLYIGTLDAWVDDASLYPTSPKTLLTRAAYWCPALEKAEVVAHHAGVRALPMNEGPIMGQHHENKHIYMALAFGGGGFRSAPLAACEVVRQVMGRHLPGNHAIFGDFSS